MKEIILIIGNKSYSPWSLRVWFFMKQFNLNFVERKVQLCTKSTNNILSEYNSDYKVPILKVDGLVVWDSLAILEYLSEWQINGSGWPTSVSMRAIARSMVAEMHSSFTNIRGELPFNLKVKNVQFPVLSDETLHEIERISLLWNMCESYGSNSHDWLFGKFSIVDAMYAPIAIRFSLYKIPMHGYAKCYLEKVMESTFIQEWIEYANSEKEYISEEIIMQAHKQGL